MSTNFFTRSSPESYVHQFDRSGAQVGNPEQNPILPARAHGFVYQPIEPVSFYTIWM